MRYVGKASIFVAYYLSVKCHTRDEFNNIENQNTVKYAFRQEKKPSRIQQYSGELSQYQLQSKSKFKKQHTNSTQNKLLYVHTNSNHPSTIRQNPKGFQQRSPALLSSQNLF